MSTLPLQFVHVPTIPGLARLLAPLAQIIEVVVVKQARARAAHEHSPFIDW